MKKNKIRIGLAGVTNHGETILTAIRAAGSLELGSLFDIKTDEASRLANKLQVKGARSYEELIKDDSLDAIALVTPNHLHAEQVQAASKASKHVFVEKPLAGTIADARRMIEWMRAAGLVLMVGHNTRRRPMFRKAKQILAEGRLGSIVGVEMNLSRSAGLQAGMPAWKANTAVTPILPMTQLGIHFVDVLHYLFDASVEQVSCAGTNIAMSGGVIDSSAALLKLSNGIPVTLSSYYVSPETYFCHIYGTAGILRCSNAGVELELLENGQLRRAFNERYDSEGYASYIEEMNEFGESILKGKRPETGGEEGLKALAVIEAMVLSQRNRSVVSPASLLKD